MTYFYSLFAPGAGDMVSIPSQLQKLAIRLRGAATRKEDNREKENQ